MTDAAPPDLSKLSIALAEIRGSGNSVDSGGSRDSAAPPLRHSKFAHLAKPFIARSDVKVGAARYTFDIETDGLLLDRVTKIHQIVITDLDSDRVDAYRFDRIDAALEHLARADYVVGHNVCAYDLPVLHRLRGWAPAPECAIMDTLIAGRLILPNLSDLDDKTAAMGGPKLGGKLRGRYSLEAWGARLGIPKIGADIKDWSVWTSEMEERCIGDTNITKALYHFLQPDSYSKQAMELEHRVSAICNRITADGIPFDTEAAGLLYRQWAARRAELEAQLHQQFPGTNLNSRAQIGALLEARGWVPDKRTEKTKQPKIDDELLERIPAIYPEFAGLGEHYTLGRRLASLADGDKAWSKYLGEDGRIHGAIVHIGTPHSRATHFNPNIAQVPNPKKGKPLAAECRALFHHDGDWVFVSCDQAGLQDRGFAHYLAAFDGGEYGRSYVAGKDPHWGAATALGLVSCERDKANKLHGVIREGCKSFRYGFLFGARAKRLGEILSTTIRAAQQIDPTYRGPSADGARALQRFEAATPGLKQLRQLLEAQAARQGWVTGLDGRRVPTDAQYKALNRIVTAAEAVVCKRWLIRVYDELSARFHYGWDGDAAIVAWIHDELVVCCRPEIAEQVGELMVRHAKEPGAFYDLKVSLDAEYKIGRTWAGDDDKAAPSPLHDKGEERAPAPPIVPVDVDHEAEEAAQWLARNAAKADGGCGAAGDENTDIVDVDENADSSPEAAPPWEQDDEPVVPQAEAPPVAPHGEGPPAGGPPAAPAVEPTNIAPADARMGAHPYGDELGAAMRRAMAGIGGNRDSTSTSATPAPSIVPDSGAVPIGMVENGDGLGAAIHRIMAEIGGVSARSTARSTGGQGTQSGTFNGNGAGAPRGNGRDRSADGDYGERPSEKQAGKPYGPVRAQLSMKGYALARTFAFMVPGETAPLFNEDRYELRPGIAPTKDLPRKTCRFWHTAGGRELIDTGPRRIIFNWPAIMAAGPGATVFITEGANKSTVLNGKGLLATAAPYHKWEPECVSALAGANLIYLEDHDLDDAAGANKAREFSAEARKRLASVATSFRIVPAKHLWKNLGRKDEPPHGWDVKDWIEAGGNAAKLLEICKEIPDDGFSAVPLTVDEWLSRELPPVEPVVGHILHKTVRAIISGPTGGGKTIVCMALSGFAGAGIDFIHWGISRPYNTLFIDGEMSRRLFKERIEALTQQLGSRPEHALFFNKEDIEDFAPLNTAEGQAAIWKLIEECEKRLGGPLDFITFDNIVSLIVGDMKEEDAWRDTMPLVKALTKRQIGQLWVHHTGHDASRGYGTKTREWQMDLVMHMTKVERPDTDVSFTLSFPKKRECTPSNREDFADVNIALVDGEWVSELTTGNKKQPSPTALKYFETLRTAAANNQVKHIGGYPTASLDEWMVQCLENGLIDPKATDNNKRAHFAKYKLQLIEANWIAANTEVAWILP